MRKRSTHDKPFNWLRKLSDIYDLTYRRQKRPAARKGEAYEAYAARAEHNAESDLAGAVFI